MKPSILIVLIKIYSKVKDLSAITVPEEKLFLFYFITNGLQNGLNWMLWSLGKANPNRPINENSVNDSQNTILSGSWKQYYFGARPKKNIV